MDRRWPAIASALFLFLGLLGVACAATPERPTEGKGLVFEQPLQVVRRAAESALVVHGFDVTHKSARHLQGFRPRKAGFFVGSGGETVGVWLEPIGQDRTRVVVSTAKSLVGYLGQKQWDDEIYDEIRRDTTRADLEELQR